MTGNNESLILIVDDNMENLKVLGGLLNDEGYLIAVSTNGKDALDFTEKSKPDLILLDIMMPGMNGYETCEKLKENAGTKDIPVIFLSALGETDDIVKGFEAGGVDYVMKPYNSRELLARVKTHIDLKKAMEEIRTLRGIIPICAKCKKIRDDHGFWEQVEEYVAKRSGAIFSHSVCPECARELYGDILDENDLK
ncbi:MAG TPA: response regulator [Spirochaetota bacterium]|nr:response regulator [Spirochaetota bacterium]HRZ25526.1 response regulator [Spirochaetota bacterium]HSA13636.1 response regulator [Spirochaetota bacterium]